uniref:Predicted protein n=1 Tax=Hordeum vulgare subsp. vulgare TaxID=112509 RepID=F2ED41_HORVV|nr:predicted protein [Hordeum vulgare subsp. vulgare]
MSPGAAATCRSIVSGCSSVATHTSHFSPIADPWRPQQSHHRPGPNPLRQQPTHPPDPVGLLLPLSRAPMGRGPAQAPLTKQRPPWAWNHHPSLPTEHVARRHVSVQVLSPFPSSEQSMQ